MAYEELKQRQSVVWGTGPYQPITETITDIHELVVERLAPQQGDRWLDLACGTGAVAERAAAAGANVTGVDLAPALIETAKQRAAELGLEIEYVVGDAERLELADASFDKVSSTCGIMFTPDHEASARRARTRHEAGRPHRARQLDARPAAWRTCSRSWRRTSRLRRRAVRSTGATRTASASSSASRSSSSSSEHVSPLHLSSGEEYWELFSTNYGPTKTLADSLDDERREELHRDWVEFFETNHRANGGIVHPREYLLVRGTRR